MSEKKALHEYFNGNNESVATFYQLYYSTLVLTAYYYLRSKEEAEDVVSDVFTRLATIDKNQRNKYLKSDIESLRTYLNVVVKNRCLDLIKVHKNRNRIEKGISVNLSRSISSKVFENEGFDLIFSSLSKNDQKILELYLEGYRLDEMEKILNFKKQTIKNKLSVMRRKMKAEWIKLEKLH